MPFGYFRLHAFQRIAGTQAAKPTIQYFTREGRHAYRAHELYHVETFRLPGWTQDQSIPFFRASERYERGGAAWAYGMQCAFPRELEERVYRSVARQFIEQVCSQQAGLWVLHKQPARDGGSNWHIHVLVSGRICDAWERPPQQFFRRYNAAEPWRGGARKDPRFVGKYAAWHLRKAWVAIVNAALAGAGLDIELSLGWTRAQQIREIEQRIEGLEQDRLENQLDIVRLQGQQHTRGIAIGSPQRQRGIDLGIE